MAAAWSWSVGSCVWNLFCDSIGEVYERLPAPAAAASLLQDLIKASSLPKRFGRTATRFESRALAFHPTARLESNLPIRLPRPREPPSSLARRAFERPPRAAARRATPRRAAAAAAMVATGNVGLAFGLGIASGLCTTLGACVVFCADLAKPRLLAASLGFAAGVMLYVSFAEIFMRKSIKQFVEAGEGTCEDDVEAYRWSTLAFFGGFLVIAILDKLVHLVVDYAQKRPALLAGDAPSGSRSNLLERSRSSGGGGGGGGDAPAGAPELHACCATGALVASAQAEAARAPCQAEMRAGDVEAAAGGDAAARASGGPSDADVGASSGSARAPGRPAPPPPAGETTSRAPPAVVEILKADPDHAFALKRMGLLTALAIFIHNFPEGLATFVAALADAKLGVGVAVAIAMHNIPEGICVAMPIYYATGSKWRGFFWATLSGMSEPIGALFGWLVLSDDPVGFGVIFALVAGMMVYISIKELLPTALKYDPRDTVATTCAVVGMVVMAASLLLFTI
jgi:ZIP family zinc transporter